MKETNYFCDFCGARIKSRYKIITPWRWILSTYGMDLKIIGGEGCKECYDSYQIWKKSRKDKKVRR